MRTPSPSAPHPPPAACPFQASRSAEPSSPSGSKSTASTLMRSLILTRSDSAPVPVSLATLRKVVASTSSPSRMRL
jgi:hypothetical protein